MALNVGKAARIDISKCLKHAGTRVKNRLLTVFIAIFASGHIPKVFKRSKIIAVLKPSKEPEWAESYRPIALLGLSAISCWRG